MSDPATPVVQLFSNPAAGSYSRRRLRALIRACEAAGARVLPCESRAGEPVIAEEATHVCVAAGDGTVRHVAAAVARDGRPLSLSIYPAGTVNLLALEAGYPRQAARFVRLVLGAAPRRKHFPVSIGDGYFFACAGVGPDSHAVARVSVALKRRIGRLAYAVSFARLLWSWPRSRIRLETDAGALDCEAFYVAKGRYYAGRWSFAPAACVGEPSLHVVALTTARRRDYLRFLWRLLRGARPDRGPIRSFVCTTLAARAAEALPLQADGDIVGALPVTMTVGAAPLSFC